MRYRTLGSLLLLLTFLLAGCGQKHEYRGTLLDPANPAPDFTLQDQKGQPFQISAQRGSVLLLFFGFTSCPDICPAALSTMTSVYRELGDDADQVRVVFVTLDPERDTLDRLGGYVENFNPNFIGLRGSMEELEPIMKAYGVTRIRRELPGSALVYTIDHSGFVYVIDRAGRWREVFAHGSPVEDFVVDLRYLISEPTPAGGM